MRSAHIIIDGKMIGFVARESAQGQCSGCIFDGEPSRVCFEASHQAVESGQPDCDDKAPRRGSFAYIYVDADPRQLVLPTCEGDDNAA